MRLTLAAALSLLPALAAAEEFKQPLFDDFSAAWTRAVTTVTGQPPAAAPEVACVDAQAPGKRICGFESETFSLLMIGSDPLRGRMESLVVQNEPGRDADTLFVLALAACALVSPDCAKDDQVKADIRRRWAGEPKGITLRDAYSVFAKREDDGSLVATVMPP